MMKSGKAVFGMNAKSTALGLLFITEFQRSDQETIQIPNVLCLGCGLIVDPEGDHQCDVEKGYQLQLVVLYYQNE